MTNDEIKIFSNMTMILGKIENQKIFSEEDYFNLYQLIYGYKELENYFINKDKINNLLNKKVNDITLLDLIRLVRNRYAHIDKHNEIDKLVILQTKVNKNDIYEIVNEVKSELNNIFIRDLNSDSYRLIMNTKIILNIFEIISMQLNEKESKLKDDKLEEFNQYCRNILKPLWENFDYENSTMEEFDDLNDKIVGVYSSNEIKDGIIKLYNKDIYNEMIRMLTDESYTMDKAIDLFNKIKDQTSIN